MSQASNHSRVVALVLVSFCLHKWSHSLVSAQARSLQPCISAQLEPMSAYPGHYSTYMYNLTRTGEGCWGIGLTKTPDAGWGDGSSTWDDAAGAPDGVDWPTTPSKIAGTIEIHLQSCVCTIYTYYNVYMHVYKIQVFCKCTNHRETTPKCLILQAHLSLSSNRESHKGALLWKMDDGMFVVGMYMYVDTV